MIELAEDNLSELVNDHSTVIVQYGATWCGNCRVIKPKFKRLAESNPDMAFVYVDAEKLPNSRQLAEVKNLPTFAGFKNGTLVKQTAGNKIENITSILDEITSN